VSIKETLKSSSATTTVYVEPGKIVALVSGGIWRNIKPLVPTTLDASSSYDEDEQELRGESAGLTFSWSCIQMSPVLNQTCQNTLHLSFSGHLATLSALVTASGTSSQVTLSITDFTRTRSAQSVVTIQVLADSAALLSTVSNVPTGIMNPTQMLQLTGNIVIPETLLSNKSIVQWTISDEDIDLSTIALSPVQLFMTKTSATMYLVLPPYSLAGGSDLTFSLTCCRLGKIPQFTSSVLITVNAPPRLGLFSVSPKVGIEIIDNFLFSASQWTTSNYPLYYQFGYISKSGMNIVFQSKSLRSFGGTVLPSGADSNNFTLDTFANIYDSLGANSTGSTTIIVLQGQPVTSDELYSMIMNGYLNSVDDIKQTNGLVNSLLNYVNCSLAPNCTILHRNPCIQTINTCGSCESDAYVGDSGDSNTECVLRSQFSTQLAASGTICSANSECFSNAICEGGFCVASLKSCSMDCSGHGKCVFTNSDSGLQLSECRVGDSRCTALCSCDDGYIGSTICSMNSTELLKRKEIRLQLLSNLALLTNSEYPDREAVEGWINSLSEATYRQDELSSNASTNIIDISKYILNQKVISDMDSSTIFSLLPSINSIASQNEETQNTTTGISQVLLLLQQTGDSISSNMLPGQHPVQSIQSQFRISVSVLSSEQLHDTPLILPRSTLEEASGVEASKIYFSNPESNTSTSMRSALSSPPHDAIYQSNPVTLTLSSLPCSSLSKSPQCGFDFLLPNSDASLNQNASSNSNSTETVSTKCTKGFPRNTIHNCSNGYAINITCNGDFSGYLQSHCPLVHLKTVCQSSSSHPNSGSCHTLSSDSKGTVCRCYFSSVDSRRNLQQSQSMSSIGAVSLLTAVTTTMKDTIISAESLNADAIQKEITVLVTLGLLAVVILVFL